MYCFGGPADARIQLRLTVEETIVPGPTGAGEFLAQYAPGVAWHRGRQSFVIWAGGQNLYLFNPVTKVCTRDVLGGDDSGAPETNGTFGRFRYCAAADTFILVNAVTQAEAARATSRPTPDPGALSATA